MYKIVESASGALYFAKTSKNKQLMGKTRRLITEEEQIGIARHFLEAYCRANGTDKVTITHDGEAVFEMRLLKRK
jgi:hypothetical protein